MRGIARLKLNLSSLLFICIFVVYGFTVSAEIGNSNSIYKYIAVVIALFEVALKWQKIKKNDKEIGMGSQWKVIMCSFIIMFLYSVCRSIIASKFTFRTVQEFLFLIVPCTYAILLYKTMDKETLYKNMKIVFVIIFIFYVISLGMNFKTIYNELIQSSFSESSSALESSLFCGLSLGFVAFFIYFDDSKLFRNLSILFVFMTFKRLFIVMAIFLIIISKLGLKDKSVSQKKFWMGFVCLVLFSILYYQCMLPDNVHAIKRNYGIDLVKFTSTRTNRLEWLISSQYKTYGFGSSFEYMFTRVSASLEMDIIKIFIELGYIPAFALMYSYLKVSQKNLYTFSFMFFLILNLVFSSGLTGMVSWTIYFITLFFIQENGKMNKEELWTKV